VWGGGKRVGGRNREREIDSMTQHLQDLTGLPRSCVCVSVCVFEGKYITLKGKSIQRGGKQMSIASKRGMKGRL